MRSFFEAGLDACYARSFVISCLLWPWIPFRSQATPLMLFRASHWPFLEQSYLVARCGSPSKSTMAVHAMRPVRNPRVRTDTDRLQPTVLVRHARTTCYTKLSTPYTRKDRICQVFLLLPTSTDHEDR
ncbi:hypothetical protein FB45DRAFT_54772 [Roridomyces roridus]|uniref:Uncharacterized protein n=1 Tax=Roridomyces roridus TaxID=1738132 RepID=A0AAD7BP30_9AGAR|nr:hypothetical protein FB45DRAFT_54772 [Roridomyces roridus]